MIEVQHRENGHKGAFFVENQGKLMAQMTYSWAGPDKLIIDHTDVSDSLRGKGVGNLLVEASVAYARDRNIKIIPLCTFAKSVFDKNPSYSDVTLK